MASPRARKRRSTDKSDNENESLRDNVNNASAAAAAAVEVETPRKKAARRDDHAFETPQRRPGVAAAVAAAAQNRNVAMIPATESGNHELTNTNNADTPAAAAAAVNPVTPHDNKSKQTTNATSRPLQNPNVRRAIFPRDENNNNQVEQPLPVTPSQPTTTAQSQLQSLVTPDAVKPPAKKRLIFGRLVDEIVIQPNTKRVYGIVKKLTGSIGGNGSCGPIYGELTMGSMQKMVNLMQQFTGLSKESKFLDVGSGIGKPNLHVAQDPGVAFSCGIEMELDRYRLGLKCLQNVLQEAQSDAESNNLPTDQRIGHKCMFLHGNIMEAKTFDPFTHVYMFSIGFPPKLWVYLAECWNRSQSPYMICYHGPRNIIEDYGFDVELLTQTPTSMHGSKEGHMGYIYQRKGLAAAKATAMAQGVDNNHVQCDPVFEEAYRQVQSGLDSLQKKVDDTVNKTWASQRSMTRSAAKKHGVILSKT